MRRATRYMLIVLLIFTGTAFVLPSVTAQVEATSAAVNRFQAILESISLESFIGEKGNGNTEVFATATKADDRIVFADPALEIVVRTAVGKPEGPLLQADVADLQELRGTFADIVSLDGIEQLTALHTVDLSFNLITDVAPLAELPNLVFLTLTNNNIRDIRPLGRLSRLEHLNVSANALTSLHGIEGLNRLVTFHAADNMLRDISPLESLPQLRTLILRGNAIDDMSPLAALSSLQELNIANNALYDITPLQHATNLEILHLQHNYVHDVTPLAALPRLQTLWLDNNEIIDLAPLASLERVQYISAANNFIRNIEPLGDMPQLQRIDVSGNRIRTVPEWVGQNNDIVTMLLGNPIDRDNVSDQMAESIWGTLREQIEHGPYTVSLYETDQWLEYVEVRQADRLLWYAVSSQLRLLGDTIFDVIEDGLTDVTGNGHDDVLIVEYTGGAHCCIFVHVLQFRPVFRLVDTVVGMHSAPYFHLDDEGRVTVTVHDWTFAYWKSSFADSPAPQVVLQFDGTRFRPVTEKMRRPAPNATEFAAQVARVRQDSRWETYKQARGVFAEPPSDVWDVMLDYLYTGHGDLAFRFLELAWPDDVPGLEAFRIAFVQQLHQSLYWEDIRDGLYDGDTTFLY